MNHDEFDADRIQDIDEAEAFDLPLDVDWREPESSSLTWDEETVRVLHREIAFRARRVSSDRLY